MTEIDKFNEIHKVQPEKEPSLFSKSAQKTFSSKAAEINSNRPTPNIQKNNDIEKWVCHRDTLNESIYCGIKKEANKNEGNQNKSTFMRFCNLFG